MVISLAEKKVNARFGRKVVLFKLNIKVWFIGIGILKKVTLFRIRTM